MLQIRKAALKGFDCTNVEGIVLTVNVKSVAGVTAVTRANKIWITSVYTLS